jgi:hypothetical protein
MTTSSTAHQPRSLTGSQVTATSSFDGGFSSNLAALADLLADKRWHSTSEHLAAAGTGYSARVRELRESGWQIEVEPVRRGAWRYRARQIGGNEPRRYVLGKQAFQALVTIFEAIEEEVTLEALDAIFERLPEAWQVELASAEAWEHAQLRNQAELNA